MAAPVTGIDALATAEEQLQRIFIQLNQRENSLATPLGVFTSAYDFETETASFSATGIPVTITEAAGVVTVVAAPIVGPP